MDVEVRWDWRQRHDLGAPDNTLELNMHLKVGLCSVIFLNAIPLIETPPLQEEMQ